MGPGRAGGCASQTSRSPKQGLKQGKMSARGGVRANPWPREKWTDRAGMRGHDEGAPYPLLCRQYQQQQSLGPLPVWRTLCRQIQTRTRIRIRIRIQSPSLKTWDVRPLIPLS